MGTVLVVEDNLSQREMIATVLREGGLDVVSVEDGQEALVQIDSHAPDVLVLDIIMPRMSGYEVCRRVRSDPRTSKMPIVFCSSKSEQFDIHWGIKQGADAYLSKPFSSQELIRTIKQLLQRTKESSSA